MYLKSSSGDITTLTFELPRCLKKNKICACLSNLSSDWKFMTFHQKLWYDGSISMRLKKSWENLFEIDLGLWLINFDLNVSSVVWFNRSIWFTWVTSVHKKGWIFLWSFQLNSLARIWLMEVDNLTCCKHIFACIKVSMKMTADSKIFNIWFYRVKSVIIVFA